MELEVNSVLFLAGRTQTVKDTPHLKEKHNTMRLFRDRVVMLTIAGLMSAVALTAGCKKKEEPKQIPVGSTMSSEKPVPPEVMHNRKGIDFMNTHSFDEAIREFTLAIEQHPNFEVSYSNRAAAFLAQKNYDKAMDDLNKALSINPNHPVVHYNFAAIYSIQNQSARSLISLDKALELGFNDYAFLQQDPDLVNVRKSKEFREILKKHRVPSLP